MPDLWNALRISFDEPVRDPVWDTIMFPSEFRDIVLSPDFFKLSRIMQLGPAHLVYPGATHTRRAHSIGVFEMAKRSLSALASSRFDAAIDICSIERVYIISFLAAALCHDVGHFPYAHSLKELPLREHESLTADALQGSLRKALQAAGADPEFSAAIVDHGLPPCGDIEALALFRALLSGVLDPDKLDYLNRDAWACGVPYGTQDVDFTIRHLALDKTGRPAIDERGVMAVEAVLFSKYQMYKAVYWHKSVRAATAMIKKAVAASMRRGSLTAEDLYGLSDDQFYALMQKRAGDEAYLINAVYNGDVYKQCFEAEYDDAKESHRRLETLDGRSELEAKLGEGVLVDLPEAVSFESDMPVLGTGQTFSACARVFRPDVVDSFTKSLRLIRVYVSRPLPDAEREHIAQCARTMIY